MFSNSNIKTFGEFLSYAERFPILFNDSMFFCFESASLNTDLYNHTAKYHRELKGLPIPEGPMIDDLLAYAEIWNNFIKYLDIDHIALYAIKFNNQWFTDSCDLANGISIKMHPTHIFDNHRLLSYQPTAYMYKIRIMPNDNLPLVWEGLLNHEHLISIEFEPIVFGDNWTIYKRNEEYCVIDVSRFNTPVMVKCTGICQELYSNSSYNTSTQYCGAILGRFGEVDVSPEELDEGISYQLVGMFDLVTPLQSV